MQAMINDSVENNAEPEHDSGRDADDLERVEIDADAESERERIHDQRLRQCPHAGRKGLAEHQRGTWCRD